MPRTPAWLARIDEIRAQIEATDPEIFFAFDRATIAEIFGLSQRQAAKILAWSGGQKLGGASIVSRNQLLSFLDRQAAQDESGEERERLQKLVAKLAAIRKQGPQLVAEEPAPTASLLPKGVSLIGPGALEIRYASPGEVLGIALALARMAEGNPRAFLDALQFDPEAESIG